MIARDGVCEREREEVVRLCVCTRGTCAVLEWLCTPMAAVVVHIYACDQMTQGIHIV